MSTAKARARERAEKAAAIRAEHKRRELRQKWLIYGTGAIVTLGLILAVAIPLAGEADRQRKLQESAAAPITGVMEFNDLSATHVNSAVAYPMDPPAGGDHSPVLQNCGVYTSPVTNENAVHSLEHGAVWITYSADLATSDIDVLRSLAESESYVLLSPYPGLSSPIVLSAWGAQLSVDRVEDDRIETFLAKYLQGPQTPEPGAPCSGGVGTPMA